MTAAERRSARAVAPPSTRQADLGIGDLTVRGRGLSAATGRSLATAVALALARQLPGRSARIAGLTIELPASALDAGGGIDRAALAQALARARPDPDA
jgi:hypothetical protein